MQKADPKTSGRRLALLVLGVLGETPCHGYAVARRIREKSGGVFRPGEGLLYPLLHELEEMGAITSRWEEADGRGRKVYALTRQGRERLAAERLRFEEEARATTAVLKREGEPTVEMG